MEIPVLAGARADKIARILVLVGNLLHTVGANMLSARNEELAADLDEARAELTARAELADVDELHGCSSSAAADVDEHQGTDVDHSPDWLGFGGTAPGKSRL